ncbi:MAG: SRPBCC family protein [Alphaproteobacteria bacterium]|nr:SRPBCC family protein [Alphaproteobacteria bacterium]MDE2112298.1 SRPBCC family protein [Alphaproteobacteria bacterium]MDE2494304.1 SRPBCC family protein [Alphaproteobacteria bacterium]
MNSNFVYVTYIRTTPEKAWEALTKPEFTRQFWFGIAQETTWQPGAEWKLVGSEGKVYDTGEVLEREPPHRYVVKWRNEFRPELKDEGYSRCTMELVQEGELVKLTCTHTIERENSKLIGAVSGGWPAVLSSLKSLLETGKPLPRPTTC